MKPSIWIQASAHSARHCAKPWSKDEWGAPSKAPRVA